AAASLISGSSPLAEAVTRSTGTGALFTGSAAFKASTRPFTASSSAGLVGPWLEPLELPPLYGIGLVADGRLQKYLGSVKLWPISDEPSGLPFWTMTLPVACDGKATWATAVTAS